jgi:outer membrane protein
MRILLLGLAAMLFTTPVLAKGNPVKVAYVDMQRALLEVEDGKKAKSTLEAMKKDRQGKLDGRQNELRKMQKDLENQKPFMKKEVYEQKVGEFRQKLGELQQTYGTLQRELAMEEAKLTKTIFGRMAKILSVLGKKEHYTMIFEKTESSLLWAEKHLDLTNELIRRYNAGEGK